MLRGWLDEAWYEPFLTTEEAALVGANKNAFLTAFRTKSGDIKGVPPEICAKLVEGLSLAGRPPRPRPARRAAAGLRRGGHDGECSPVA